MKISSTLSWADRLVIMQDFSLTNQEAVAAFGVSDREIVVAKNLQMRGIFAPTTVNTDIYATFVEKLRRGEFDMSSQKVFKPREVRPSKITQAFDAITSVPQPVDDVVVQYGVSLAVLRQGKRFDKVGQGQVHIRKDKTTKVLMIWREL